MNTDDYRVAELPTAALAADVEVLAAMRRAWTAAEAGRRALQFDSLALLGAQSAAWLVNQPTGMAAGTRTMRRRVAPPVLRLLAAPEWGSFLGPTATVTVQGRERGLHVRIQGIAPPEEVFLSAQRIAASARQLPIAATRVPAGSTVYELDCLNGGPEPASLWAVPGLDAEDILGPDGIRLELFVRVGDGHRRSAGELVVPPVDDRPRFGADEDGERTRVRRRVAEAVAAYTDGDHAAFAAALAQVARDGRGVRASADGRPATLMGRWATLWLRAMCAEIQAWGEREWERWGCSAISDLWWARDLWRDESGVPIHYRA